MSTKFYEHSFLTKQDFYAAWSKLDHNSLDSRDLLLFKLWRSFFAQHTPIEAAEKLFKAFPSAGEPRLKRTGEKRYAALHGELRLLVVGPWRKNNEFLDKPIRVDIIEYANEIYKIVHERANSDLPDWNNAPKKYYSYIWVRKDLDPVHQIIQAGHALQIQDRKYASKVETARVQSKVAEERLEQLPDNEGYHRIKKTSAQLLKEAREAGAVQRYPKTDHFVLFEANDENDLRAIYNELRSNFNEKFGSMSSFIETTTPGAIGFNAIAIGPIRQDDPKRQVLTKYKLHSYDPSKVNKDAILG